MSHNGFETLTCCYQYFGSTLDSTVWWIWPESHNLFASIRGWGMKHHLWTFCQPVLPSEGEHMLLRLTPALEKITPCLIPPKAFQRCIRIKILIKLITPLIHATRKFQPNSNNKVNCVKKKSMQIYTNEACWNTYLSLEQHFAQSIQKLKLFEVGEHRNT